MPDKISENLQDSLIYLAITDSEFAKKIGGQVPVEFFSSSVSQTAYKISTEYTRKFGKAPGDHFHDELIKQTVGMNDEEKELLARYLLYLEKMRKPLKEYVLSRLNDFIRSRSMQLAIYESAELVESGNISKAHQILQKALKAGIVKENVGYNYLKDFSDLKDRGDKPSRLFRIGIPIIDKTLRLNRTDLVTIAGSKKGGKTWFCLHLAKQAIKARLNAVYITHEISEVEALIRFDMMFGGLVNEMKPAKIEIRDWKENRLVTTYKICDTIYNRKLVEKNRKKPIKMGWGQLIIKKYPMGTCSPVELESYLNNLEYFHNFKADVVINDYADIMAPLDKNKITRDSINDIYIYLKGIADDKKVLMITPSQINDEGAQHLIRYGKISGQHLAEDKRKFANIDKGIFVGTSPKYESYNEAIVGVFANRNGLQGQRCIIGQNYTIGQFATYNRPYKKEE